MIDTPKIVINSLFVLNNFLEFSRKYLILAFEEHHLRIQISNCF